MSVNDLLLFYKDTEEQVLISETKQLLNNCTDDIWRSRLKNELLTLSGKKGYQELAIFLMDNGADDISRALDRACYNGHKDFALMMLAKGAQVNDGLTGACRGGNKEMILLMLEKGAYLLSFAMRNIHVSSCDSRYSECAMILIEHGLSSYLELALDLAIEYKHIELAKLLISKGITDNDIDLTNNDIEWLVKLGMTNFVKYKTRAQFYKNKYAMVESILKKELNLLSEMYAEINEY